jgi:hypothetical protein
LLTLKGGRSTQQDRKKVKSEKMFGVFNRQRNPWEELYDYETNTYFYRHHGTGEFSRYNPVMVEAKSSHVPSKVADPLWETAYDSDGNLFWTDIETGKVAFIRPEKGTFISEVPLREFRRYRIVNKESRVTSSSRKSMKSSASNTRKSRVVKRDDDFGIVSGVNDDLDFDQLFGQNNPAQFDAGAMFAIGSASPPNTNRIPTQEEEDEQEELEQKGDYSTLDEETVLAQSTIATDNPLFRYGK